MQCDDCKSKCHKDGTIDCPFYEHDPYKAVEKALIDIQNTLWGYSSIRTSNITTDTWYNTSSSTSAFSMTIDERGHLHATS